MADYDDERIDTTTLLLLAGFTDDADIEYPPPSFSLFIAKCLPSFCSLNFDFGSAISTFLERV